MDLKKDFQTDCEKKKRIKNSACLPKDISLPFFTYVKNKEEELKNKDVRVSGMLLYARTNEELIPNEVYKMSGNTIAVRTLDLNQDFEIIKSQLDEIANEYLFKIKTFSIF